MFRDLKCSRVHACLGEACDGRVFRIGGGEVGVVELFLVRGWTLHVLRELRRLSWLSVLRRGEGCLALSYVYRVPVGMIGRERENVAARGS